jgi:hypothetical protein
MVPATQAGHIHWLSGMTRNHSPLPVRLGEHRRVQAEHELMIKHVQHCQQEASLLSDKAHWNGSGWVATRANLVVQLTASQRARELAQARR